MWRALVSLLVMPACSPSSLVDVQTPNTVVDPSAITTAAGAAQLRNGAFVALMDALMRGGVIDNSAIFTDELQDGQNSGGDVTLDVRNVLIPAQSYGYYGLQLARVKAQQARQALQLYASNVPSVPKAWQGEMYALEGYTVLWFAELYCSGIPLTSVPLLGAQQLTAGITTQDLYTRAIALFDSALVAGADSAQFVNLALVGKGRALLGLGQFAAAGSAVENVPINFVYLTHTTTGGDGFNWFSILNTVDQYRVQDHEGVNGLAWSTDPRTAILTIPAISGEKLWPAKYNVTPNGTLDPTIGQPGTPVRIADGLEAQLIHAEAALAAGSASWLTILNSLRATCIEPTPCAPVPGLTSSSLPPLADPGTANARLDLIMKERAMWLYLTGHREGDLRRLAHIYGREPGTLWPTGIISNPTFPPSYTQPMLENGLFYGRDVVLGPDTQEQSNNPLYKGCYDARP